MRWTGMWIFAALVCGVYSSVRATANKEVSWLHKENTKLDAISNRLENYLRERGILLADREGTLADVSKPFRSRVAVSSAAHPLECRISLSPIPPRRAAIAPCRCSGTNEVRNQLCIYAFDA
jgi:hypothetical protein